MLSDLLTHILSLALVNDQLYANHKSPCFYFHVLLLFFFHSVAAESNTPVWFEPVSVAKSRRIVSVAKYVSASMFTITCVLSSINTNSAF